MSDINFEEYGRMLVDGEEVDIFDNGDSRFEKAVPTTSAKAALATMKPTRVVRNLFDKDGYTEINVYVNSATGVITAGTASTDTQYCFVIPCKPNTAYTMNTTGYASAWGTFTSSVVGTTATHFRMGNGTLTSGANDKYLIGLIRTGAGTYDFRPKMMLNEGSTAQPYYPFFSPSTILSSAKVFGKTERTIVIEGKRYIVPSDVELVDGVFSDTDNYFTTFLNPTQADKWVIDIQFPTSTTRSLIGYATNTGAYFGKDVSDRYELGGNMFITPPPSATDRHTVVFDMTTLTTKLTVDGVSCTRDRQSATVAPFKTVIPGYAATGNNVYSMFAYKGDVLVGAYYPCVKDGVAELYDFVSGKLCTKTGQPTAGKKTKTVRTKNLFDKTKTTYHMYYTATGVWQTASSVSSSDFIEVKPNTTYVLSGTSMSSGITRRVNLLDADKNWISQPKAGNYPLVVTTTAETKYIRFSYGDSSGLVDTNIQLEEASTATEYIPYTIEVPLYELYGVGEKTANLFSSGLAKCTWAQVVGQEVIKAASNIRVGSADFITLKPNTTYTIKMMGTQTFTAGNWRVMLCDADNICRHKISTSATGNALTFTTASNEVKFVFFIAEDKTSTEGWDWMLIEGTVAPTEYIPYGYAVDVLLGSQGVVDMGTLNYTYIQDAGWFRANLPVAPKEPATYSDVPNAYCNALTVMSYESLVNVNKGISIIWAESSFHGMIWAKDDRYTNAASFKAAMSGIMLYYQRTDDATWQPPTPYTFYTDRQLHAVGSYEDILTSNNDGTGSITGAVGVKVLDGTENWAYASVAQAYYVDGLVQALEKTHTCYCTHFVGIPTNQSSTSGSNEIKVGSNTSSSLLWNRIYAYASLTDHPTVADFKAYLAQQYANGTPVTVYYPLATPATTQLTGLPVIELTEKAQYTMENTNTIKGEMQATYLGNPDV